MRIAVNTRFLLPNRLEGLGVFTHETMKRITQWHPEHEFLFLFDRSYDKTFIYNSNITPKVLFPQARHPVLWYWWFEGSVARAMKKFKPDIFLSPDGYLSLRTQVPSVPVIHDLAFEHYPNAVPWRTRKYYKYFFPKYAHKADQIATVSQFSKNDLILQYGIEPEKIDVVYNGANEAFQPIDEEEKARIMKEVTGGSEYFAYVGSLHQRKNIVNLLKAFDHFKRNNDTALKLVIIGRKAWGNQEMEEVYQEMDHHDQVIFTGNVNQDQLVNYLGAARALTYLSFFEGFGIPLVEAMYADVPVITSEASSLPEVAGEAGLICDPYDVEGIANAMKQLAFDEEVRQNLIQKGREQRERFSWDKTAEKLWHVIEKAAYS